MCQYQIGIAIDLVLLELLVYLIVPDVALDRHDMVALGCLQWTEAFGVHLVGLLENWSGVLGKILAVSACTHRILYA